MNEYKTRQLRKRVIWYYCVQTWDNQGLNCIYEHMSDETVFDKHKPVRKNANMRRESCLQI